ncbi:MAG: BrnT family toxin [Synergistaceae bacterium]|nr:BrnT family toxin [Synergistaceae bacterium]
MEFEWDENKRQSNIIKHKIDFAEAVTIYDEGKFTYTYKSIGDYGEDRYVSIGILDDKEIAVVYTTRDDKRRIISLRRARINERKLYYAAKPTS